MRYAIYFIPDPSGELYVLGSRWLGYDIETGTTFAAPVASGLSGERWRDLVSTPARYGLHATLKAPFRLAASQTEAALVDALREFARQTAPIRVPVLSLNCYRGFFALQPAIPNEAVAELAARAVRSFEPFRAPLTPAEFADRCAPDLSEGQKASLERWGYPYVFGDTKFHITLTSRLRHEEEAEIEEALTGFFEPVIGRALAVDRVALAVESETGARFEILAAAALGHPLAYSRRVVQLDTA